MKSQYMKNNTLSSTIAILSILLLANCGGSHQEKEKSRKARVPSVNTKKSFITTVDHVRIIADVYDSAQCEDYFGVDLVSYGIQPIVFEIHNDTPEDLEFRSSYIDLDMLSGEEIAQALHYNTWAWAGGTFGLGWLGLQLFAPFSQLILYTPLVAYMLHKQNTHITQTVDHMTYNGSDAVLVFEPYTRNHFMVCVQADTFKPYFGLRFFFPDQKKLINTFVHIP